MNSVSKNALLSTVGKCVEESPMALVTGLFVLHMLVCISVGSDLAKLHCSNPDQHRGEGGAIDKHGFPIGFYALFSTNKF